MSFSSIAPHPAVLEEGRREPIFLYDAIQTTFFSANARYFIEVDSLELDGEIDIIRFTHSHTGLYTVMAKNQNIIERPDLVLPWGHARVRTMNGKVATFWNRKLTDHEMTMILTPRMQEHSYAVDAIMFSAGPGIKDKVDFSLTSIEFYEIRKMRKAQAERIQELTNEAEQHHLKIMGLKGDAF